MKNTFQVWDNEYCGGESCEIVFTGDTLGEAESFIDGAVSYGTKDYDAFSIRKTTEEE